MKTVDRNGTQSWYDEHGLLHRDNGLPAIIYTDGAKAWYKHGEFIKRVK